MAPPRPASELGDLPGCVKVDAPVRLPPSGAKRPKYARVGRRTKTQVMLDVLKGASRKDAETITQLFYDLEELPKARRDAVIEAIKEVYG